MWETWVSSLGWEDPLEEVMATHSSILAWRIPMDRGAWQATVTRSRRVRHDQAIKHSTQIFIYFLLYVFFFFNFILFLNLKHCISFAKHQNESTTGIHTLPILSPPPSSLPTPSLWVVPVHQPQASSIMHRTWTGNSFHT